jgi:hypothetical protein
MLLNRKMCALYKYPVNFLQRVYKNVELCHCVFIIHENGSKIMYNMFYSVFIKNAEDF